MVTVSSQLIASRACELDALIAHLVCICLTHLLHEFVCLLVVQGCWWIEETPADPRASPRLPPAPAPTPTVVLQLLTSWRDWLTWRAPLPPRATMTPAQRATLDGCDRGVRHYFRPTSPTPIRASPMQE